MKLRTLVILVTQWITYVRISVDIRRAIIWDAKLNNYPT